MYVLQTKDIFSEYVSILFEKYLFIIIWYTEDAEKSITLVSKCGQERMLVLEKKSKYKVIHNIKIPFYLIFFMSSWGHCEAYFEMVCESI